MRVAVPLLLIVGALASPIDRALSPRDDLSSGDLSPRDSDISPDLSPRAPAAEAEAEAGRLADRGSAMGNAHQNIADAIRNAVNKIGNRPRDLERREAQKGDRGRGKARKPKYWPLSNQKIEGRDVADLE